MLECGCSTRKRELGWSDRRTKVEEYAPLVEGGGLEEGQGRLRNEDEERESARLGLELGLALLA